jgi:hypothetical protein
VKTIAGDRFCKAAHSTSEGAEISLAIFISSVGVSFGVFGSERNTILLHDPRQPSKARGASDRPTTAQSELVDLSFCRLP